MLLLFLPQFAWTGSSAGGYDLTLTANSLLSRLGAASWADLDWVTEAEVFSYFDEAAKRLATHCGAFVERDATGLLAADEAQYATPLDWISSIHVSTGTTPVRLRPSSVSELLALDGTWQTTPATVNNPPARYSMDAGPLGTITLYPLPQAAQAGQTLAQIYHRFPADIGSTQTLAPIPSPVSDYFLYFALMRCRGKQSEGAMPEVAAHAEERGKLYEQIFSGYYGESE